MNKIVSRNLSTQQSDRLRTIVRRELSPLIPKQNLLATILGVAQGNFSRFLDGTRGGTIAMAFRVAFLLERTVDDVLGLDSMPKFVDELERRFPTRILAARAAYLDGVALARIHSVLGSSLKYDGDPGVEWWLKMMRSSALAGAGSKEETLRAVALVSRHQGTRGGRARKK